MELIKKMNCPNCNSPYVSFVTRQGKLINKKKRKRNRIIIISTLLIGSFITTLTKYGTLITMFSIGYWIACKIKEKRLPNDHIEMICHSCGTISYIEN